MANDSPFPTGDLPRAFGTRAVAAALGRSEGTVRRWIRAGVLPNRRPGGGRYLITEQDVAKLLWDQLISRARNSAPLVEGRHV
jgi:excisionase family DNA binding protein